MNSTLGAPAAALGLIEGINANYRAAMRVYPHWSDDTRGMNLFEAAAALGAEHDNATDCGIETLVVFLGANNALPAITKLKVEWSKDPDRNGKGGFQDLTAKNDYTVWRPEHFAAELKEVVAAVERIEARHVIWCTVPHVTIAPLARGVSNKVTEGSRYYPYYTQPWISDDDFRPWRDLRISDRDARAVDCAIDMYNEEIQRVVESARRGAGGAPRDWYLLDIAGLLDRLASRRYITDRAARPSWWTDYPLPPALAALDPPPDSQFLAGNGQGGRAAGCSRSTACTRRPSVTDSSPKRSLTSCNGPALSSAIQTAHPGRDRCPSTSTA